VPLDRAPNVAAERRGVGLAALGHPADEIGDGEDVAGRIDALAVAAQRLAKASEIEEVDLGYLQLLQSMCFRPTRR
jgi:hypothetical protein